jgi:hypothetical protein
VLSQLASGHYAPGPAGRIASDLHGSVNACVLPVPLDEGARSHPVQPSLPPDSKAAMLRAQRMACVAWGGLRRLS